VKLKRTSLFVLLIGFALILNACGGGGGFAAAPSGDDGSDPVGDGDSGLNDGDDDDDTGDDDDDDGGAGDDDDDDDDSGAGMFEITFSPVFIEGLEGLDLSLLAIEVLHINELDGTESWLTLWSGDETLALAGIEGETPAFSVPLAVEPGWIVQVRLILGGGELTIEGETFALTLPSADQTGIKLIGHGELIRVGAGWNTKIAVAFDPDHSLVEPGGDGYLVKPVLNFDVIYEGEGVVVDAGPDAVIELGETVELRGAAFGTDDTMTFEWTPGDSVDDPAVLKPVATPIETATYILQVFDVDGNLIAADDVTVTVLIPE